MLHARHPRATPRRLLRAAAVAATLAMSASGCSRFGPPADPNDPRFDPILIHVRNENFLDMNVAVVVGGSSRRLGPVSGNASGDFNVPWFTGNGSGVVLTATPIGGRGNYITPALNIGPGQMIDFKIGSVLAQSVVTVHEP